MSPSKRKRREPESLLSILLEVGDIPQLLGIVDEHAVDLGSELLAALDELAPLDPLDGPFGDPRVAVFTSLVIGLARNNVRELIPRLLRYTCRAALMAEVVEAIATLGPTEALPVCELALKSENEYVRGAVARGAAACATGGWGHQDFLRGCFDMLASVAHDRSAKNVERLPVALLTLHRDRASGVLLDRAVLSADNPRLHNIVKALNDAQISIPADVIRPLLAEVQPRVGEYPFSYAYSALLESLRQSEPDLARHHLEEALNSADQRVRSNAVISLLAMDGMESIYRNHAREEYERWPHQARVVADLASLMLEIESNGLSGVFVNGSPSRWRVADESLRTVEASASAAVLTEMAIHAGVADPSLSDRDLSKWIWPEAAKQNEDRLNAAWRADPDRREVCILRYMRKHRSCFLRPPDDR